MKNRKIKIKVQALLGLTSPISPPDLFLLGPVHLGPYFFGSIMSNLVYILTIILPGKSGFTVFYSKTLFSTHFGLKHPRIHNKLIYIIKNYFKNRNQHEINFFPKLKSIFSRSLMVKKKHLMKLFDTNIDHFDALNQCKQFFFYYQNPVTTISPL